MFHRFWPIVIVLAALGCNEPLPAISIVDKFRVMAVQADPPEIHPGEGTVHRVLYADPKGDGRPISFIWLTCLGELKPSSDLSGGCELLGVSFGTSQTGGDVYHVPPVPNDVLDDLTKNDTKDDTDEDKKKEQYKLATTVLSACAGGEAPTQEELTGITGLDNLDVLCKGGDQVLAFKTFRISNADDKNRNTNPEVSKVVFNKTPLKEIIPDVDEEIVPGTFNCKDNMSKCLKGAKIEAGMTKESFESYEETRFGNPGAYDESPYISWFATGGEFNNDRSRTASLPGPFRTTWSPPLDGGAFTLWAVAHDLRGGTSWKKYAIAAQTPIEKKSR